MIIRALNLSAENTVKELLSRIVKLQNKNGSWKLYSDEKDGNLSATIQAYTAMLLSGKYKRADEEMIRAEHFITSKGGVPNAHFMTKLMLSVNGMYEYPGYFYFPMTYFLLPPVVPISMFHCSNYARVHLTPMIICMNKKFSVKHGVDTGFFENGISGGWFREDRESWTKYLIDEVKNIALTPLHLHKSGYAAAERLMLDRIEKNGTLFSYASSTFYMIYALLALGYKKDSSLIQNAFEGIKNYKTMTNDGCHIQNSPSTVWDTGLLSYALQEAGMESNHPVIVKANGYLLKKQQQLVGDWIVNAPSANPGGWGFSDSNHFIPDNDDTSAVLRALFRQISNNKKEKQSWDKGLAYLLAMQNKDGGWGAFEKNAYHPLLAHLPIENAKDALIDNSTADLTGRVLEFLGNYAGYTIKSSFINRAVKWLLNNQNENGSWYGKWGICYLYGTWAALTGLSAIGLTKQHPAIKKAVKWLESVQHEDGGFGESCKSPEQERFVPLHFSTPSQTSWGLDALLTVRNTDAKSVKKAISFLLNQSELPKEALEYPTGLGLPGGYYIYYESYNEIFPLLALGHYRKKLLLDDLLMNK